MVVGVCQCLPQGLFVGEKDHLGQRYQYEQDNEETQNGKERQEPVLVK